MKVLITFTCLLASTSTLVLGKFRTENSLLHSHDARDVKPTCTYPIVKPQPAGSQCGVKATIPKSSTLQYLMHSYNAVGSSTNCAGYCLNYFGCSSFSFNSVTTTCQLFSQTVKALKVKADNASKVSLWDRKCYKKTCTCPKGQRQCPTEEGGPICADLKSDTYNCGACNNACEGHSVCANGSCVCPASKPFNCATGKWLSCSDLKNDNYNCGKCGTACPSDGSDCVDGICSDCPPERPDVCPGNEHYGPGCVNLATSVYNCGTCGNWCSAGLTCNNGKCGCPPGKVDCDGQCVTETTGDCGTCGNQCPSGGICQDGQCQCPPGQSLCDSGCVDLTSNSNCGTCGNACGPGQFCNGGQCQCYDPAAVNCLVGCFDLQNDHDFCGSCDNSCPGNSMCVDGKCGCQIKGQVPCPSTNSTIGGCYSLEDNPDTCGSCGISCNAGEFCEGRQCRKIYTCPYGGGYVSCKEPDCSRCFEW